MRHKCKKCDIPIVEGEDAMVCDLCEGHSHRTCLDYSATFYKNLNKFGNIKWFCPETCAKEANDNMTLIRSLTNRTSHLEDSQRTLERRLKAVEDKVKTLEDVCCDSRLDALENPLPLDEDDLVDDPEREPGSVNEVRNLGQRRAGVRTQQLLERLDRLENKPEVGVNGAAAAASSTTLEDNAFYLTTPLFLLLDYIK